MANDAANDGRGLGRGLRIAAWSGAALLLLLPVIATQFTAEVNWTASDFVFAAVLLFASAGAIDIATRSTAVPAYLAGVVVAVAAAFLTIWVNAAVGMIGSEDNPYNLWFGGVVVAALLGAMVARFGAGGMARVMALAAIIQSVLGAVGMSADLRGGVLSTIFAGIWLLAAALFRRAARHRSTISSVQ